MSDAQSRRIEDLDRHERPPALGTQLPIWPGAAPGSETWTWSEQVLPTADGRSARNIAVPTLEVHPPTAAPTGMAVIVAPGGAWTFLMVDKEGADLARWLAARGIAAFVLRYRERAGRSRLTRPVRYRSRPVMDLAADCGRP